MFRVICVDIKGIILPPAPTPIIGKIYFVIDEVYPKVAGCVPGVFYELLEIPGSKYHHSQFIKIEESEQLDESEMSRDWMKEKLETK